MNRKEWYATEHAFRLEERIKALEAMQQTQACQKRMQFRRAVKAMFVNRAIRTIQESNTKMFESILRITK